MIISSGFHNESQSVIDLKKINIIVGPNNSGKSTILKDIERWFNNKHSQMKLLRKMEVCFSDNPHEYNEFEKDILDFEDGQRTKRGDKEFIPFVKKHLFQDIHDSPVWYNLDDIKHEFNKQNTEYFREHFFKYFVIRLDGKKRFQLLDTKHYHVFRTTKTPIDYLSRLYNNADDEKKLGEIVNEEFGWHTHLRKDEQNNIDILLRKAFNGRIDRAGQQNHTASTQEIIPVSEFGDGVQCFIGICLSVLSCPFRIVMIDEPEAYLHPPTAYSLGKNLSRWATQRHCSLIVSTHSADFLMGCLHSIPIAEISVIRLTYQNNIGMVKKLEDSEALHYSKDPLLRSTDVLNALFYTSAVITEGPDDKAVYQEANNKLLRFKRGILKTIFLNAIGKHVVHRIVRPLRKIGIPSAAIYDFDVVKHEQIRKEKKTLWETILSSSNVEFSEFGRLEKERQYIESEIRILNTNKGKNEERGYFKQLVRDELSHELYSKISDLFDELRQYGIFIVPVGTLEEWLKEAVVGNSDEKFINLLNKIDKTQPIYGDIWQFIDDINNWLSDPNRKGMQAKLID